jgi:hypothetical protein
MEPGDLTNASRDALSQLLACNSDADSVWNATDLHAILCHQLDADVEFDLTHFGGVAQERMTTVRASAADNRPCTFGQMLTSAEPPLEVLDMIRRFAKRSRTQDSGGIPKEVATVLYYAAIAAAKLRHGISLSKLDDEALRSGLAWGLEQTWLTEPLRDLFTETLRAQRSHAPKTDA